MHTEDGGHYLKNTAVGIGVLGSKTSPIGLAHR